MDHLAAPGGPVRDLTSLHSGSMPISDNKIDPASHSLTLSDVRRPDAPLVYINKGFERMTGYTPAEAIGRNCRFLQGPDTDPAARAKIRAALETGTPLLIDLLNYRKDGTPFWNRLSLRPVTRADGVVTHFIGIQSDITKMRELEERLHGYALELGGGPA